MPSLGSADFKLLSGTRFIQAASAEAGWGAQGGCQGGMADPHPQFSVNQQVAASLSPAAMRSRLLLSVAHLPTIRESLEEILPGGPGQEPLASLSLDDYMRSIRQLAQPTSVLDESAARARRSRPHWLFRAKEKSCPTGSLQDISTCFRSQQPTLPGAGNADPLDWLFGQSQEKQLSWRDPPRRTGSSTDPWGPHGQMDSSKAEGGPRRRLCDARVPGHSLARPSRDWHPGSWASGQHSQATASPPSSRPSSTLRALYAHLPVIQEL